MFETAVKVGFLTETLNVSDESVDLKHGGPETMTSNLPTGLTDGSGTSLQKKNLKKKERKREKNLLASAFGTSSGKSRERSGTIIVDSVLIIVPAETGRQLKHSGRNSGTCQIGASERNFLIQIQNCHFVLLQIATQISVEISPGSESELGNWNVNICHKAVIYRIQIKFGTCVARVGSFCIFVERSNPNS